MSWPPSSNRCTPSAAVTGDGGPGDGRGGIQFGDWGPWWARGKLRHDGAGGLSSCQRQALERLLESAPLPELGGQPGVLPPAFYRPCSNH